MDANIKKQLLDPRNTRELVKITKTLDIEKLQLLLNEIDIAVYATALPSKLLNDELIKHGINK